MGLASFSRSAIVSVEWPGICAVDRMHGQSETIAIKIRKVRRFETNEALDPSMSIATPLATSGRLAADDNR
jgi:hypothetical protein